MRPPKGFDSSNNYFILAHLTTKFSPTSAGPSRKEPKKEIAVQLTSNCARAAHPYRRRERTSPGERSLAFCDHIALDCGENRVRSASRICQGSVSTILKRAPRPAASNTLSSQADPNSRAHAVLENIGSPQSPSSIRPPDASSLPALSLHSAGTRQRTSSNDLRTPPGGSGSGADTGWVELAIRDTAITRSPGGTEASAGVDSSSETWEGDLCSPPPTPCQVMKTPRIALGCVAFQSLCSASTDTVHRSMPGKNMLTLHTNCRVDSLTNSRDPTPAPGH